MGFGFLTFDGGLRTLLSEVKFLWKFFYCHDILVAKQIVVRTDWRGGYLYASRVIAEIP